MLGGLGSNMPQIAPEMFKGHRGTTVRRHGYQQNGLVLCLPSTGTELAACLSGSQSTLVLTHPNVVSSMCDFRMSTSLLQDVLLMDTSYRSTSRCHTSWILHCFKRSLDRTIMVERSVARRPDDTETGEQMAPGKRPTWNLKMDLWKVVFLYNPVVFPFCGALRQSRQNWRGNRRRPARLRHAWCGKELLPPCSSTTCGTGS